MFESHTTWLVWLWITTLDADQRETEELILANDIQRVSDVRVPDGHKAKSQIMLRGNPNWIYTKYAVHEISSKLRNANVR